MAGNKRKIALLRGINVGGRNKVKMADLRDQFVEAGLADVSTYIQSGNICFESTRSCTSLTKLIHDTIESNFGHDVPVMVREQAFFAGLIVNNPFCSKGKPKSDIKELHATLLEKKPPAKNVKALAELEFEDEYRVAGDVVYLRIVTGYSKTKLTNAFFEKKLGVAATTRNWKTVCKLAEM